jgi:UDP-N-acetylmuramoyl-L-alanyl-D-glutamate--2,6-diaminopimelate ligase
MTLQQVINLVSPHLLSGAHCNPSGKVTDDSRQVRPGDIFVAVRGKAYDGHKFIALAIQMGAVVVICEELFESDQACILVVSDTRKVLGPLMLAAAGDPQNQLNLIAVTGTNGKTTVSTLISQVLTHLGITCALVGTVGKQFGNMTRDSKLTTPGAAELAEDLRIAIENECTYFIMEVSSHALEQGRTQGLNFDLAVFTNLTHDHLDYHGTMEAYASAKQLLFNSLSADDIAIINFDDAHGPFMARDTLAQVWDLSLKSDDFKVEIIDSEGLLLNMDGIFIKSPLTGRFNAYNVAQAYLSCVALGFAPRTVAAALEHCRGAAGRLENMTLQLQPQDNSDLPMVFVDYAHTPDALKNVLETLQEVRRSDQEIITVFGCGGDRDRSKRPTMAQIAAQFSDRIIVTSDNPRFEIPDDIIEEVCAGFPEGTVYERITDRIDALENAILTAPDNALVLIAGKGHENYQEVRGTRYPMDDREITLNMLYKRREATQKGNP